MYEYRFILDRVIDGDSIVGDIDLGFGTWMVNQHVRLNGIDAPESRMQSQMNDRDLGDQMKLYGQAVTNWLNSYIQGTILTIKTQYDSQQDKYGRILADVYSRDTYTGRTTHVNEFMVESGLALEYNGKSPRSLLINEHISNMRRCQMNGFTEATTSDIN